jgi:hypothetical protein
MQENNCYFRLPRSPFPGPLAQLPGSITGFPGDFFVLGLLNFDACSTQDKKSAPVRREKPGAQRELLNELSIISF